MADKSAIEWTDATWNPIVGCSIVSPGCTNCYAMKMAARLDKMLPPERRGECVLPHHYTALTKPSKGGPVWTGRVNIAPEHILTQPLRWNRDRRVFVNSMGDLFHESIPDEWIDKVFAVMALCPRHMFQVLTKRAERMHSYLVGPHRSGWASVITKFIAEETIKTSYDAARATAAIWDTPFLPNVWLGVSTERQQEADERIPHLLETPAAVRFISAEPLLGPINLRRLRIAPDHHTMIDALEGYAITDASSWSGTGHERTALDWVIVGGESGSGARPMHPDWARSLRDQCAAAGVQFFFKQWGEWLPGEANRSQFDERPMHAYRRCDDHSYEWPRHGETQNFGTHEDRFSGDLTTKRVGKKSAGRLLDGKEHNEIPVARSEASPS